VLKNHEAATFSCITLRIQTVADLLRAALIKKLHKKAMAMMNVSDYYQMIDKVHCVMAQTK
jgi:hypothetical protein